MAMGILMSDFKRCTSQKHKMSLPELQVLCLVYHEENGDLKGVFCLCIHFPLSSIGDGRVPQSPALGAAFLSSMLRAATERVQVPQSTQSFRAKAVECRHKIAMPLIFSIYYSKVFGAWTTDVCLAFLNTFLKTGL